MPVSFNARHPAPLSDFEMALVAADEMWRHAKFRDYFCSLVKMTAGPMTFAVAMGVPCIVSTRHDTTDWTNFNIIADFDVGVLRTGMHIHDVAAPSGVPRLTPPPHTPRVTQYKTRHATVARGKERRHRPQPKQQRTTRRH